jgi:hypothetical protein
MFRRRFLSFVPPRFGLVWFSLRRRRSQVERSILMSIAPIWVVGCWCNSMRSSLLHCVPKIRWCTLFVVVFVPPRFRFLVVLRFALVDVAPKSSDLDEYCSDLDDSCGNSIRSSLRHYHPKSRRVTLLVVVFVFVFVSPRFGFLVVPTKLSTRRRRSQVERSLSVLLRFG